MAHPTIADTERVHTYTVVASQDTFAVTFPVFKRDGSTGNGDIDVYVDGVLQSPSTWSFSGTFSDGVANGGNVVLDTAISSGTVRIVGHITAQRDSDYAAGGIKTAFLNTDFDRLVAMHREGQLRDMRALKIPAYEDDSDETPVDQVVPDLADRKGKVLGFDPTTGRPKVSSKSLADFDSGALPANKTADTLADLKALTPEVGDVALLLGHQSINDQGGGHFYWDENSAAADDNGLTILPTGHSGNGRWLRIVGNALTPQMFGAAADGSTDDTTAMQAVWTAAVANGIRIFIPAGTYRITDTLTEKPALFVGEGTGRSVLVFDDFTTKDGMVFQAATTIGTMGGLVGLELVAKTSTGVTCVEMPKSADQYDTYFTSWVFRDLYCRGDTRNLSAYSIAWNEGFATWFRLSDCRVLDFEHVLIQGIFDITVAESGQTADAGIEMDAASALLSATVSDITFGPIHTAIKIGANVFFHISTFDLIGTFRGIYQSGVTALNEPKIFMGNINAQETGIWFDGSDARDVNSVTIRRHDDGLKSASHDWYGIKANDSDSIRITGCIMQPDESGGAFGGTSHGVHLTACGAAVLSGNMPGLNLDFSFLLDNCPGAYIGNTVLAGLGGTFVRLNNNSRRVTIEKPSIQSSSATYTELSDDGSVDYNTIDYAPRTQDLEGNAPFQRFRETGVTADNAIWQTVVNGESYNRQVQSDDLGTNVNYELINRTGTNVDQIEWRADQFKLNNGPIFLTGTGTPEGVVTADVGSFFLRTDGGTSTTFYVKESGTGNTGWVAK